MTGHWDPLINDVPLEDIARILHRAYEKEAGVGNAHNTWDALPEHNKAFGLRYAREVMEHLLPLLREHR